VFGVLAELEAGLVEQLQRFSSDARRQCATAAQALRKPMTGTEICTAARTTNPHIQLHDVWHLFKEMQELHYAHK